jgi:hypothetical protein
LQTAKNLNSLYRSHLRPPPPGGCHPKEHDHASSHLPPHQDQRPSVPRSPAQRLGLLLLSQPPAQHPRPLPQQGPLPVLPDHGPPIHPPTSRRRGPRVRPASHLLRHQCAGHRLHRPQRRQLAALRPPACLCQRPRTPYRPQTHPTRPRHLQGAPGHHPRSQPRHSPTRPHLRDRRLRRVNRTRTPLGRSRHPERSEGPLYFARSATTYCRHHPTSNRAHPHPHRNPRRPRQPTACN